MSEQRPEMDTDSTSGPPDDTAAFGQADTGLPDTTGQGAEPEVPGPAGGETDTGSPA